MPDQPRITTQDIKLFASKVMSDVPEGGGGSTGIALQSGTSNNIFRDVREQDLAGGNLSMRQLHVGFPSGNTAVAMGVHVMLTQPPTDPNVSVVLMSTAHDFATRAVDLARLESGYIEGIAYNGQLFGNHVKDMQQISLMQRPEAPVPTIGTRLALVLREGYSNKTTQFVSVLRVEHSVQSFEDGKGVFERRIVTLTIGQRLAYDYPGFDPMREWPTQAALNAGTRIRSTVWGNAAKYYGVQPLAAAAARGSFTVHVPSITARVVPSAEAETIITDARTSQQKDVLVQAGGEVSYSVNAAFDTNNQLYIGGSITPGSLSLTRAGAEITDNGSKLMYLGLQVGTVDYANGICALLSNVAGSGVITVRYKPAAQVDAVTSSHGILVTAQTRSQSIALTLPTNPMPGSLQVSFQSSGNWYVLSDDGSGKMAGADASSGVGTLNRYTKTLSLTLGAAPDVGSMILLVWARELATDAGVANPALDFEGKFFIPINSAGQISTEPGRYIQPGTVNLGGLGADVTDDGAGNLVGGAAGRVDYSRGVMYVIPANLPAKNTLLNLQASVGDYTSAPITWTGAGSASLVGMGPAGLGAGSVRVPITLSFSWLHDTVGGNSVREKVDNESMVTWLTDDGNGRLLIVGVDVGSVDYVSGALTVLLPQDDDDPAMYAVMAGLKLQATIRKPYGTVGVGSTAGPLAWAVSRADAATMGARYGKPRVLATASNAISFIAGGTSNALQSIAVDAIYLQTEWISDRVRLGGVGFTHNNKRYRADGLGNLLTDTNASTGNSSMVGSVGLSTGVILLNVWAAAVNTVTAWSAYQINPVTGSGDLSDESAVYFRTAAAPLRPGGLQLVCTMQDGTEVQVTANAAGKINHGRVKGVIDYESGWGYLIFCSPVDVGFGTYDVADMQIAGVDTVFIDAVMASSIRYNCVAYEFIPVDPAIVGVEPVRLPSDGRVPIYEVGYYVKVIHTKPGAPCNVSDGQLIDLELERLSSVVIWNANGQEITHGWARDLDAGKVRILHCADWVQPVRIDAGIEHMALARDVQINGQITLNRALSHDFPLENSFVTSCLMLGDRYARVSLLFDQKSWGGITFLDYLSGEMAIATYYDTLYPVEVDNTGAITERWALQFTSQTNFRVLGESVGVIATGSIHSDCAPINPTTGTPYFTVHKEGFGGDWTNGNVIRFNTVGAGAGFCVVRAIQPGDYTALDHRFALRVGVDVDRPANDGTEEEL